MGNYSFDKDLPIAQKTEIEIAGILETYCGLDVEDSNFTGSQYDIKAVSRKTGKTVLVEAKEDFKAEETGNIFVEFTSWGRRTGLLVTKADFYLYKIHFPDRVKFYVIDTKKLIRLIKGKEHEGERSGGDFGSDTKGWILNIKTRVEPEWNFMLSKKKPV